MAKTPLSSGLISNPKANVIGTKINSDIIDTKKKVDEDKKKYKPKKVLVTPVVEKVSGGGGQSYARNGDPWYKKPPPQLPPSAEVVNTGPTGEAGHNEDGGPGNGATKGGVTTDKTISGNSVSNGQEGMNRSDTVRSVRKGGLVRGHGLARTRSHKAKW